MIHDHRRRKHNLPLRIESGRLVWVLVALVVGVAPIARAQDAPADGNSEATQEVRAPVDPYEAVREGNKLLKDGKPAEALELYQRAEREKPGTREIAYAEGLSQYHLGDYEQARDLFRKAAAGKNDALADDATYSLGTTYHSDALLSADEPKAAMADLEHAMAHYQNVLSHNPDHPAARDAYRKAGAFWRKIKRQQQEQPQSSDKQDNKDDNQDDQNQDKQKQEPNESDDQEQDSDKQEPSDQQDEEQQDQEDKSDQEQESSESEQDSESQEQQQSAAEQEKEQVSREQAQRKLREMMQSLRERKEKRRQPTRLVPLQPVEKDW